MARSTRPNRPPTSAGAAAGRPVRATARTPVTTTATTGEALTFVVPDAVGGSQRLDKVLRHRFPEWGRQTVGRIVSAGEVQVNGRAVLLASWQVAPGDRVRVAHRPATVRSADPEAFDDRWLIADEAGLVAVDKPAGLLCEPARDPGRANLRDLTVARFGSLVLVHRLDRDTSGVVLFARPGASAEEAARAFAERRVVKEYVAVVDAPNALEAEGTIDLRMAPDPQRPDRMVVVTSGGQRALTRYQVAETAGSPPGRRGAQLVRLQPLTGRTHQLRVHLAALDAPILGDRLYGRADAAPRMLLHAERLRLPATDDRPGRTFEARWPKELRAALRAAGAAAQRRDEDPRT